MMSEDDGSSALAVILGGMADEDEEDGFDAFPKFEDPELSRQEEARRAAEGAAARRLRRAFREGSEREMLDALKDAVAIVTKKKR